MDEANSENSNQMLFGNIDDTGVMTIRLKVDTSAFDLSERDEVGRATISWNDHLKKWVLTALAVKDEVYV